MHKRRSNRKTIVRILAIVLAGLMLLSVMGSLLNFF